MLLAKPVRDVFTIRQNQGYNSNITQPSRADLQVRELSKQLTNVTGKYCQQGTSECVQYLFNVSFYMMTNKEYQAKRADVFCWFMFEFKPVTLSIQPWWVIPFSAILIVCLASIAPYNLGLIKRSNEVVIIFVIPSSAFIQMVCTSTEYLRIKWLQIDFVFYSDYLFFSNQQIYIVSIIVHL